MDSAIIVGAGTFGASLAWWLSREGVAVTLIDQFEPGDARASSGGETRLLRCSHGGESTYTVLARRSRELWRRLEEESGEEVYLERGVAWFAHREDGWEGQSARELAELRIPVERLDPEAAAKLFPSFRGDDLEFVLLEPEAGALRAARAVRVLVEQAQANGARFKRAHARPAGGAGVALQDGSRLEAGFVVWACGPWLADLFPGLVSLRVTRQDLFFFAGDAAWSAPTVPAWVDYDLATYGTSDLDGLGVKVAPDGEGPALGADEPLPPVDPDNEPVVRGYLGRRFPGLVDAPLAGARTCRYELAPDSHFLVGPHPEHARVWLLGGGSGHGFKHGPALAELFASVLRGTAELPPQFALRERAPGRSLRTAGSSPGRPS